MDPDAIFTRLLYKLLIISEEFRQAVYNVHPLFHGSEYYISLFLRKKRCKGCNTVYKILWRFVQPFNSIFEV